MEPERQTGGHRGTGSQAGRTAPTGPQAGPPDRIAPGRIVIAGGTGFIGRALCAALASAGHEVVVLSRGGDARLPGAQVVRWDAATGAGPWTTVLRDAHAVVNLCGSSIAAGRWTAARKRELIESRVRPSRALLEAISSLDARPAMLLQASGVGCYGTGDKPADDASAFGTDFLARLSAEWEATLAEAPIPTAALRFGVVLGSDGALPRMLLPFRFCAGGPIGDGHQWLSWIHVDDAVAAIRFAIERRLTGPVNVTAPRPVRNRAFATSAGRILRRPAWLSTPVFVLRLALGEQATLVCEGQQALPARLTEAGFHFRHPSLESALADLCT